MMGGSAGAECWCYFCRECLAHGPAGLTEKWFEHATVFLYYYLRAHARLGLSAQ